MAPEPVVRFGSSSIRELIAKEKAGQENLADGNLADGNLADGILADGNSADGNSADGILIGEYLTFAVQAGRAAMRHFNRLEKIDPAVHSLGRARTPPLRRAGLLRV